MKIHAIAGMPRAGSTLLCNVLNQNPLFHASSTSCSAQAIRGLSRLWSNSPEIKSELLHDKQGTEKRMVRTARAVLESWYEGKGQVVFDKCRFWNNNADVFHQLLPASHIFLCIRDLRAVFGSIEKQNAKNPLLDHAATPLDKTQYRRADQMFGPEGMIGQQIVGIDDMLARGTKREDGTSFVHVIQYESLVRNPQLVMNRIYSLLGVPFFEHNYENVENTATDADALYLNKFPHEGSGKIEPRSEDWPQHVSPKVAGLIMDRFASYNKTFGYFQDSVR